MRKTKTNHPFLIPGDPGYAVLMKWQAAGICCKLDALGTGVTVVNCTFDKPPPPVPKAALDELGQWHDEILSHLRYWRETRQDFERIRAKHNSQAAKP